jgi:pre-mRNA-splicing factor 38B
MEDERDEAYDENDLNPIKKNNTLPLFGNKETMNINNMIITNIRQSRYFKTDLFELKTFHQVVDEIYYRVTISNDILRIDYGLF